MGWSIGELTEFKQKALTESIKQMAHPQGFYALDKVFNTIKKVEGTDTAEWDISRENRKLGKFAVQDQPSIRVGGRQRRKMSAAFAHIFMHLPIPESVLLWCKSPDDNTRERAAGWILDAQAQLVSLESNLLEWAGWQALQGEMVYDASDDPNAQIIITVNYGFRDSHMDVNETLDWSDPDTLIISDTASGEAWGDVKKLTETDAGVTASVCVCNDISNRYLFGNLEVQKLWSDKQRDVLIADNRITQLDRCKVDTYDRTWLSDDGETATNFVPDEKFIFLPPEGQRQTFVMLEGECMAPAENDPNTLVKVQGRASWVERHTDPTEMRIYLKRNALPVPMDPDAVVCRTVVPEA